MPRYIVKSYKDGEAHKTWFGVYDLETKRWLTKVRYTEYPALPFESRRSAEAFIKSYTQDYEDC